MPPDQVMDPFGIFLMDPIILAATLLPLLILGALLIYRIRFSRRFAALTKRNAEALDKNAARWQESTERAEKMIVLLTEIRDHMARIAPGIPEENS